MDQPGIRPGALVRSLAGRDRGSSYVVLKQIDESRVTVCDGHRRSVDRPKRKNRRHLEVLAWADTTVTIRLERGDKVSDQEIVRVLSALSPHVLEEV